MDDMEVSEKLSYYISCVKLQIPFPDASNFQFNFDKLPNSIRRSIHEKLPYTGYATFDECSKSSHALCETLNQTKFEFGFEAVTISEERVFFLLSSSPRRIHIHSPNFPLNAVPNILVHTDLLYIPDPPNDEASDFLLYYVRFCHKIKIGVIFPFPKRFSQFLKARQPDSMNIVVYDSPIPQTDFSDIGRVEFWMGSGVSTTEVFRVKTARSIYVEHAVIIYEDFVNELKQWSKGEFSVSNTIFFRKLELFSLEDFKEAMQEFHCEEKENRSKYAVDPFLYEWTVERESNPEEKLIVDYSHSSDQKLICVDELKDDDDY